MLQAVILAGGQATRMRPYTDDRPKAMVEVAGLPIIEHQIRWLVTNDVHKIVVSCGYKADMLEDFLGDGSRHNAQITYAIETEPLGRGGGLKFAARHLPDTEGIWLAMNGDVISDLKVKDLVDRHNELGVTATVALAPYQSSWGVAELEGNLIRGFVQSPKLPYWINAGIYCMSPSIIEMFPDIGDHEESTFPELATTGRLGAFFIEGYWRGIDTAKDLKEASQELK
ncbi:MAG: nucleotidyltransferase family protein [Actinomycetota bacterium]